MVDEDKPSIESIIKHHGILGMKWGVRKLEDSPGKTGAPTKGLYEQASTKEYLSIGQEKRSGKEADAELEKNAKKFAEKFKGSEESGSSKKGLSDTQKKLLIGLGIAALVGGIIVYKKYGGKTPSAKLTAEALKALAGKPIALADYKKGVQASMVKTWGAEGYMTPGAFARPDYTLPKGHIFTRLSEQAETTFAKGTYSTHSPEDFNRYLAIFRLEKGIVPLHKINFASTKPVKVASLTNTLDTLQDVMTAQGHGVASKKDAMRAYQSMSGGGWSEEIHDNLFKALSKKGYGAIVDEMDAGVIGESPLVFFSKNVTSKTSRLVTPQDIQQAESNLVEILNRKL